MYRDNFRLQHTDILFPVELGFYDCLSMNHDFFHISVYHYNQHYNG
jgi:hypothetical protein